MDDKDYQKLMEIAEKRLKKGYTEEEAQRALYNAGIYDKNGNFTKPYKNLDKIFIKK
jgi:hypothetical protein